jgi:hypothetical protein
MKYRYLLNKELFNFSFRNELLDRVNIKTTTEATYLKVSLI